MLWWILLWWLCGVACMSIYMYLECRKLAFPDFDVTVSHVILFFLITFVFGPLCVIAIMFHFGIMLIENDFFNRVVIKVRAKKG